MHRYLIFKSDKYIRVYKCKTEKDKDEYLNEVIKYTPYKISVLKEIHTDKYTNLNQYIKLHFRSTVVNNSWFNYTTDLQRFIKSL